METNLKRGDVVLCKSHLPTTKDLVINVESFNGDTIIDKDGMKYSVSRLRREYKSFHKI